MNSPQYFHLQTHHIRASENSSFRNSKWPTNQPPTTPFHLNRSKKDYFFRVVIIESFSFLTTSMWYLKHDLSATVMHCTCFVSNIKIKTHSKPGLSASDIWKNYTFGNQNKKSFAFWTFFSISILFRCNQMIAETTCNWVKLIKDAQSL